MRMHPKGVKNALPVTSPVAMVVVVTVTTPSAAFPAIGIAVASVTSEVRKSRAPVGSATVPTPITCIMTVNEFRTLLVPVSVSTSASLGIRIHRYCKDHQQTYCHNPKHIGC